MSYTGDQRERAFESRLCRVQMADNKVDFEFEYFLHLSGTHINTYVKLVFSILNNYCFSTSSDCSFLQ